MEVKSLEAAEHSQAWGVVMNYSDKIMNAWDKSIWHRETPDL